MTSEEALEILGLDWPRSKKLECPAHPDKTPSLQLYDDNFYCYSCGRNGDAIGMIALFKQIPIAEALKNYGSGRRPVSDVPIVTERSMRKDIEGRFVDATQPLYNRILTMKDDPWVIEALLLKASEMTDGIKAELRESTPYEAEMLLRILDRRVQSFRVTWDI